MQEIRGLTHLHFIMIVQGQLSQTNMAVKADRTPTVRGSKSLNTYLQMSLRRSLICVWFVGEKLLSAY